jgi:hypothetical protein
MIISHTLGRGMKYQAERFVAELGMTMLIFSISAADLTLSSASHVRAEALAIRIQIAAG